MLIIVGLRRSEATMNVYGHVSFDNRRRALGQLDDKLGSGPDSTEE